MLRRRYIRILLYVLAGLLALIMLSYLYYRLATNVSEPEIASVQISKMERISSGPDEFSCEHG